MGTIAYNNNNTWVVPERLGNNNNVLVEVWGGSGGGGSNNKTTNGGAGGGGGAFASSIVTPTPSASLTIVAGIGGGVGTSNNSNGNNGTYSSFNNNEVMAMPGLGGNRNGVAPTALGTRGAGGNGGNSIGTTKYSGGNGAGNSGTAGGGGGAAASSAGAGPAGSGSTGGTGNNGAGNGGNAGTAANENGYPGTEYGGGGGGSGNGNAATKRGGVGAAGGVRITWTDDTPYIVRSASSYIAASAADPTTAQLTAPSGKTSSNFQAGNISDDTNPITALDLGSNNYTELEFCIKGNNSLIGVGDEIEFRIVKGGVALSNYNVTPKWIVGSAAVISVDMWHPAINQPYIEKRQIVPY